MLIQGKILNGINDLVEVFDIRREVFVKELGFSEEEEFDNQDYTAMHVIVYEEDQEKKENLSLQNTNKAVATGRISYDGMICTIGHVAVLKEFRGKKYGDFAVRMLLNKAFTSEINEVIIKANENQIAFYEKIGFHKTGLIETNKENSYYTMIIKPHDIETPCKRNKV